MADGPSNDPWLAINHYDGTREHVRLTLALTTFGRSEHNVIELLDPKLSRFHCEIERRAQGYVVRDCSSRNGTLVNGDLVGGTHALNDGDRIKIGRTLVTFHSSRPAELRTDAAVDLTHTQGESEVTETDTPPMARRRPTEARPFDRRQTQAVQTIVKEKPWRFLVRASAEILDAPNRGRLLELAVELSREYLQAHGALIVLGRSPETMSITASVGVAGEEKQRCMDVAGRVLTTRAPVATGRQALGVPLRGSQGPQGALVLHDLAGEPRVDSAEFEALQALADLIGRTVTSSLRLEEVRRDERAAGARRIAVDLRLLIRPSGERSAPGLEVGLVSSSDDEVGCDFWDRFLAPPRAGRTEVYFALGDVPDLDAPLAGRLRRRGERSFVSLVGQAELRGALRSLVETLPRTSDLVAQLDLALRRGGSVDRLSLVLCRYDPTAGVLRFSGAGHYPVLVRRRDGSVESFDTVGPALGTADDLRSSERDLKLEPGDQVLLASQAARLVAERAEPLDSLFARMAVPAHDADEIASRLLKALEEQPGRPSAAGLTLLLLRRS